MNRIYELIYNFSVSNNITIEHIIFMYSGIKSRYNEVSLHFKMFNGLCYYNPDGVEWILSNEESDFCNNYRKDFFSMNTLLIMKDYNTYIRNKKLNNLLNESN